MGDEANYNFPNDKEYTMNALVEELNLLERHLRDGSYRLCSCSPSKHLPTIAGMSSEGMGFAAEDGNKDEAKFMESMMNQARQYKKKLKAGYISDEEAGQIRSWAREQRRRIEMQKWTGELPKTSRKDELVENGNGNGGDIYGLMVDGEGNGHSNALQTMRDVTFVTMPKSRARSVSPDISYVEVSPSTHRKSTLD